MPAGIGVLTDPDSVSLVHQVKNPWIQGDINSTLTDWQTSRTGTQQAFNDYLAKYKANQGQFDTQIGQESAAADQFYNGNMAQRLSELRAKRSTAVNSAADVAAQQAMRSVNSNRLTGQGSGSSYDQRVATGALVPIRTQAALDDVNQQRSDLGYVTQNQLALTGQREDLGNRAASYGLAPEMLRQQMNQSEISSLGGITNLDQANNFYGLKKDRNFWGELSGAVDQDIASNYAMFSSIWGMGGGGGGGGGGAGGGMAHGGFVRGPGSTTSDSIPIRVSDGEFIVRASAVKKPGVLAMLRYINSLGEESQTRTVTGGYADGGEASGSGSGTGTDYSATIQKYIDQYGQYAGMLKSGGGAAAGTKAGAGAGAGAGMSAGGGGGSSTSTALALGDQAGKWSRYWIDLDQPKWMEAAMVPVQPPGKPEGAPGPSQATPQKPPVAPLQQGGPMRSPAEQNQANGFVPANYNPQVGSVTYDKGSGQFVDPYGGYVNENLTLPNNYTYGRSSEEEAAFRRQQEYWDQGFARGGLVRRRGYAMHIE